MYGERSMAGSPFTVSAGVGECELSSSWRAHSSVLNQEAWTLVSSQDTSW